MPFMGWAMRHSRGDPIRRKPDLAVKMVKMELAFYKHTHRADVTAGPGLFRLINIDHEETRESVHSPVRRRSHRHRQRCGPPKKRDHDDCSHGLLSARS